MKTGCPSGIPFSFALGHFRSIFVALGIDARAQASAPSSRWSRHLYHLNAASNIGNGKLGP